MFIPIDEALRVYKEEQSSDGMVPQKMWQETFHNSYDYTAPSSDVLRHSGDVCPSVFDPLAHIQRPLLSNEVFFELSQS